MFILIFRPYSSYNWKFTLLPTFPYFPHSAGPGNHFSTLWVYEFECFLFLDFTYKWYHAVFVFLWLTLLSIIPSGSSILLQMKGFPFYSWLNNILYICISHLIYSFICLWTLRLFSHHGYWNECCSDHGSADISSISCFHFLWVNTQKWDC